MHQRSPGQPTFLDLATAELGGPRTAALLDRVDAFVPWDAIADPIRALPTYAKYVEDPTRPGGRPIDPMVPFDCASLWAMCTCIAPRLPDVARKDHRL